MNEPFTIQDQAFMRRCFELARLGIGRVSPNPAVGAVLVYQGRIIGEGYHAYYGGPHAEVMAVNSVAVADQPLISQSTLYVSLEPCCIYGKTPPCTSLILAHRIPRVVISQLDHTPAVYGQGVQLLRDAGVAVKCGLLPAEGLALSLPRQVFAAFNRPYVLLKYARSLDGFMAPVHNTPYWLTNGYTRRLTHRWRTQTDAILIGAGTAMADNPSLTSRYYPGRSPLRIVLERHQLLPAHLAVFDQQAPTWLFTNQHAANRNLPAHVRVSAVDYTPEQWLLRLLQQLASEKIGHLTVEGGATVLRAFIDAGLWDEARILTAPVQLGDGLPAPSPALAPQSTIWMADDRADTFFNPATLAAFAMPPDC